MEKEPCPYILNCERRTDSESRGLLISLDRRFCEYASHVLCPTFVQYQDEKQTVFNQGGLAVLAK